MWGLTVGALAAAWYFYPMLPERVASHWGANGEVNGYMSRFWGVFLMPIVMAGMALLFMIVPRMDPKRKNIEHFRKYFDTAIVSIALFLFYIFGLTISWNLGNRFDMGRYLAPAIGGLFIVMGVLVSKAEPNWTIGIRTPWTLSSEAVWKKTHALGGTLFKISGILAVLGAVFPSAAFALILVPILATVISLFLYSYFEYRKER